MANAMKAFVIIYNTVVEARRDKYESDMAALEMYDDNKRMFQQSIFECKSREEMEGRTLTPLTDEVWAVRVPDRKSCLTSSVDHFALKHDLIAHIAK